MIKDPIKIGDLMINWKCPGYWDIPSCLYQIDFGWMSYNLAEPLPPLGCAWAERLEAWR